jgi:hypothetical protein
MLGLVQTYNKLPNPHSAKKNAQMLYDIFLALHTHFVKFDMAQQNINFD